MKEATRPQIKPTQQPEHFRALTHTVVQQFHRKYILIYNTHFTSKPALE